MRFSVDLAPAKEDNVAQFDDVRISVLSDRIIRVEKVNSPTSARNS